MANEFKIRKGLIVEGASGGVVVNVLGSQGQLLSVTDDLSGTIFAVSDISGVPVFDVNSSGLSTFDGLVSGITPVNAANFVTKAYVDGSGGGTGPFLPLSGGTLTGALAGTSASFTGALSSVGYSGTSGTFSASVTASGNSNSFGNTTTAALTATSGTFSASVTAAGNSNSFGASTFTGQVNINSGNELRLYRSDNATYARFNYAAGSVGLDIDDLNGDGINLQQAGVNKLRIETTGNATFAGNVTTGSSITATGNTGNSTLTLSANTGNWVFTNVQSSRNLEISDSDGTGVALTIATNANTTFATQAFATTATSTGDASSTLTTKGYVDGLITGATIYRGTWDPDITANSGNGTPDLSTVTQTSGYYYICSDIGTAHPNGTTGSPAVPCEPDSWAVGDWVIWNDDIPDCAGTGTGAWQKIDNTSVLSGIGTGQTVALWEGTSSVTDSETLGNAPITVSGNNTTFAGDIKINNTTPYLLNNDDEVLAGSDVGGYYFGLVTSANSSKALFIGDHNNYMRFDTDGDEAMRIDSAGNVGIGVTGPTKKLDVVGSSGDSVVQSVRNPSTSWSQYALTRYGTEGADFRYMDFGYYRGNVGSEATRGLVIQSQANARLVTFLDSGDVGIGTTSPSTPLTVNRASNSTLPTLYLDTDGGGGGSVGLGQDTSLGPYLVGNTLPNGDVRGAYSASRMLFNGSGFSFQTSNETSGTRTFDDKMKILINGNVGIGTTLPGAKLDILNTGNYESIRIQNSQAANVNKQAGITSLNYIGNSTSIFQYATNNGANVVYYGSADGSFRGLTQHSFMVSSGPDTVSHTQVMKLTSTGIQFNQYGAGTLVTDASGNITAAPAGPGNVGYLPLSAGSSYPLTGNLFINNGFTLSWGADTTKIAGNSSTNVLSLITASTTRMYINSTGNVGIGATSVFTNNHILNLSGTGIAIKNDTNGSSNNWSTIKNTATSSGSNLVFQTATGTTVIDDSGHVGINKTTSLASHGLSVLKGASNQQLGCYYDESNFAAFGARSNGDVQIYGWNGSSYRNILLGLDGSAAGGNVGIGTTSPSYRLQIGVAGGLADSIRIGSYAVAKNTRQYIGYTRADSGLFESSGDGDTPSTVLAGVAGIRIVNTTGTISSGQADNSVQLLTHIYNGGSRVALHANYNGNVGIGTTSPGGYRLVVENTSEDLLKLHNSTDGLDSLISFTNPGGTLARIQGIDNGGLGFDVGNNAGGINTNVMFINSSGNVGIGTTTPLAKLDIQGTQGQLFSVTDDLSGSIFAVADISGVPIFDVNSSGVSYFDGNVGIGTDSPGAKLEVKSSANLNSFVNINTTTDAYDSGISLRQSSNYGFDVYYTDDGVSPSVRGLYFDRVNNGSVANAMFIDRNSGNVGIGTTSVYSKLGIAASSHTNGFSINRAANTTACLYIGNDGNSTPRIAANNTDLTFGMDVSGAWTEWLRITGTGKIGIRTTTPVGQLSLLNQINGGTNPVSSYATTYPATTNNQSFFNTYYVSASDGYGTFPRYLDIVCNGSPNGSTGGSNIRFFTNPITNQAPTVERMRIDSSGNVGIGTDSPQYKLQVEGDMLVARDINLSSRARIVLDDEPFADPSAGSGTIVKWSVSSATTAGLLYILKFNGSWTAADADFELKSTGMVAISLGADADEGMLLQGFFYKSAHGFTIGLPLYISNTAGAFTNTRPTGSNDYVRVIGYATSANHIYFDPDKTWVQVV